jgi:hypothetical protein
LGILEWANFIGQFNSKNWKMNNPIKIFSKPQCKIWPMIFSSFLLLSICSPVFCATFNEKLPACREKLSITTKMAGLSQEIVKTLLGDILKKERLSEINFLQDYEVLFNRSMDNRLYILNSIKLARAIGRLEYDFGTLFPNIAYGFGKSLELERTVYKSEAEAVKAGSELIQQKIVCLFDSIKAVSIN